MTPNAITTARAQQSQAQIEQFKTVLDSTMRGLKAQQGAIQALEDGLGELDSLGLIPALTDVKKIAAGVKAIAQAQLLSLRHNVTELTAQANALETQLKAMANPSIIQPVFMPPPGREANP